jgi:repressor of nif and glnA expression
MDKVYYTGDGWEGERTLHKLHSMGYAVAARAIRYEYQLLRKDGDEIINEEDREDRAITKFMSEAEINRHILLLLGSEVSDVT